MATTAEKQAERPAGIESTAKRVLGPLSWLTHVLKRIPYAGYKTALRFEDALSNDPWCRLAEWWSDELALGVQVEGLEHLPPVDRSFCMPITPRALPMVRHGTRLRPFDPTSRS